MTHRMLVLGAALGAALVVVASASAHARLSPPVAVSKKLQLFTLAVPTEKNGTTTTIRMTPPSGFDIDSFVPSPGWKRSVQQSGSGDSAVIKTVTWSGGHVPTGEDSTFSFLAQPDSSKTYTFDVQQTYSDGSVVDWNGPETADDPAPTIEAKSSLGGGGTTLLTIVALALGAVGVLLGVLALVTSGGRSRPLA